MNDTQRKDISRADAVERYEFLVKRQADAQELWGLSSDEGWLLLGDDEQEAFPVWPAESFARQYAAAHRCDESPVPIVFATWMEEMLPYLAEDGVLVAVFPTGSDPGVIVSASDLLAHLQIETEPAH